MKKGSKMRNESKLLLNNLNQEDNDEIMYKIRKSYYKKWQHLPGDEGKIFFEKTPCYLILPDVPETIETVCPWKPKIIVILRNPIDRLQSHHKMNLERARGTAGMSLDQVIDAWVSLTRGSESHFLVPRKRDNWKMLSNIEESRSW